MCSCLHVRNRSKSVWRVHAVEPLESHTRHINCSNQLDYCNIMQTWKIFSFTASLSFSLLSIYTYNMILLTMIIASIEASISSNRFHYLQSPPSTPPSGGARVPIPLASSAGWREDALLLGLTTWKRKQSKHRVMRTTWVFLCVFLLVALTDGLQPRNLPDFDLGAFIHLVC